jgi:hypothetical protein
VPPGWHLVRLFGEFGHALVEKTYDEFTEIVDLLIR